MKVLVTGGGGFLGRHLALRLHQSGCQVSILGRRKYTGFPEGIEGYQADLRDREAVAQACMEKEAVFHTAALTGIWGKKKDFYEINVEGTRNVIEGCQQHGVKKLIYTSSPSVIHDQTDKINIDETAPYPTHYLSEYPRTKAMAEKMVLAANGRHGLLTVSLRPHLIWGPGDPHLVPRIVERARRGQLVQVGDGKNRVDIIYIDNAVAAHWLACQALCEGSPVAGRCYFLSDGEPVLLWQWIQELLVALNLPPLKKKISYRTGKWIGLLLETVHSLLRLPGEPRMTRFLAAQLATSHYFNIARARQDFNYKPVVPPDEGMRRLLKSLEVPPEY